MWPDFDPEEIEPAVRHIDQYCLIRQVGAAVPSDPRRQIVNTKRHGHHPPLKVPVIPFDAARKYWFARGIKRLWLGR